MNFSNVSNTHEQFNSSIDWNYIIFPTINGEYNVKTDLKYVVFPVTTFYYLYFTVKLVVKYKAEWNREFFGIVREGFKKSYFCHFPGGEVSRGILSLFFLCQEMIFKQF